MKKILIVMVILSIVILSGCEVKVEDIKEDDYNKTCEEYPFVDNETFYGKICVSYKDSKAEAMEYITSYKEDLEQQYADGETMSLKEEVIRVVDKLIDSSLMKD